jgi:antitoxin (DNA-binding transcriptional repressor) of toxin-antitoxin stability system
MRFLSVRELRGKSAAIWKELQRDGEMIITSNGKPIAILSPTSEDRVEESVRAIRRARASAAVSRMQRQSVLNGRNTISADAIEAEIIEARESGHR